MYDYSMSMSCLQTFAAILGNIFQIANTEPRDRGIDEISDIQPNLRFNARINRSCCWLTMVRNALHILVETPPIRSTLADTNDAYRLLVFLAKHTTISSQVLKIVAT